MRNGMQKKEFPGNLPFMLAADEGFVIIFLEYLYALFKCSVSTSPPVDRILVKFDENAFTVHVVARIPIIFRFFDGNKIGIRTSVPYHGR